MKSALFVSQGRKNQLILQTGGRILGFHLHENPYALE